MLEKNRDNIAKALPGLAKYQITQGETVANGFYYNAYVANLLPGTDSCSRSSTTRSVSGAATNAGQPPDNAGPRAEFPSRTTAFREARDERQHAASSAALVAAAAAGRAARRGRGVVVRQTFFGPKTITAYFTSATAIYPGDEVRVAGVKVGTIESIEPQGTQAKMTLARRPRRARPGRRESGDRRPEPGRRALRPAHACAIRASGADHGRRRGDSASTAPRCPSNGTRSRTN